MVEHVRRRALLINGVSNVYVATCDQTVSELVKSNGGKVLMTSSKCGNGTERASEASSHLKINIQSYCKVMNLFLSNLCRTINCICKKK